MKVTRQRGGNIYVAHRQWAVRPDDETYETVQDLHEFCSGYRVESFNEHTTSGELQIRAVDNDLKLFSGAGLERDFTNFSFGQLCRYASMGSEIPISADMLAHLPAENVESDINFILSQMKDQNKGVKLLVQEAAEISLVRAITSELHDRVWNADVTGWLVGLPDVWKPPKSGSAATGLYGSDHDMFAFLAHTGQPIKSPTGSELVRGFMIANNEVGTGSLLACMFLADYICENHIVWNIFDSFSISVRHVGNTASMIFSEVIPKAVAIMSLSSAKSQEDAIRIAATNEIAKTREDVVNFVFEKRIATKKLAEAAYDYAENRDGLNPRSYFGMVQGLTAEARAIPYYDKRYIVEQNASKLLEMAA